MKTNIRGKIKRFFESEDGRVSTKAPFMLGIATGSVLLAQAMIPAPAEAHLKCHAFAPCPHWQICVFWHELEWPGPIVVVHSECVDRPEL